MSRPTIDYPWVKHEQKSKEKNPLASHPQNLIQKKRQGLIIGTTKKSLLCSKTRLGQTFEFFGEWLLRSFPNWSRPLSMSDDMWSLVRAAGRVYKGRTENRDQPVWFMRKTRLWKIFEKSSMSGKLLQFALLVLVDVSLAGMFLFKYYFWKFYFL